MSLGSPLDVIEAHLDLVDRALAEGEFEELSLPDWSPPHEPGDLDPERLTELLGRIESSILRIGQAKQNVTDAQTALARRRQIARVYATSGT